MQFIKKIKRIFVKPPEPEPEPTFEAGTDVVIMPDSHIDPSCEIGSYTYIGYNCFITKAKVGRYVSIGNNVSIGPGEHSKEKISTSHIFSDNHYEELTKDDCIVGNDVWIGVNAVIKRGVKVGDGAIIGANSFVNKDVPDFAIFAGTPAKLIRYRFSDEIIEEIKKTSWWEKDAPEAKKIVKALEEKIQCEV